MPADGDPKTAYLWIPGPLPGLNELLDARAVTFKSGMNGYTALKKRWEKRIAALARAGGFPRVAGGKFVWRLYEKDCRRDPSNALAGALKLVEDALVGCGLLKGDGWACVREFKAEVLRFGDVPGLSLCIYDCEIWERTPEDDRKDREKRLDAVRRRIERSRTHVGGESGGGLHQEVPPPAGKTGKTRPANAGGELSAVLHRRNARKRGAKARS